MGTPLNGDNYCVNGGCGGMNSPALLFAFFAFASGWEGTPAPSLREGGAHGKGRVADGLLGAPGDGHGEEAVDGVVVAAVHGLHA